MPAAHCDQESSSNVDKRMGERSKAHNKKEQKRERKTGDYGHYAENCIGFYMLFGRRPTLGRFRQIWEIKAALTAVTLGLLFGFSASWAEHNIHNDHYSAKVWLQVTSP
jgi:hypothetical protein